MAHRLVYVSCAGSREIDVFTLTPENGELQRAQRLPTTGMPQPLALSADRRILLAGMAKPDALQTFAVDPASGQLHALGAAPAADEPVYVSADGTGCYAFSASYRGNHLCVFPLAADGTPMPVRQTESPLMRAHACRIDAGNRWLLVPLLGEDAIRVYRFGPDGALTPADPAMIVVRPGSGPRHLVMTHDNRRVYCLNELDGTIDQFDFDADRGQLSLRMSTGILPPGFTGAPWGAELRATPDGRFLYASERTSSTIAVLAVDPTDGDLRLIEHVPTETQPRGMAIEPGGRWLLAAGQKTGQITVYALDPESGRLSACRRYATGQNPICVEALAWP